MEQVTLIIAFISLIALGIGFIYFSTEQKTKHKTN